MANNPITREPENPFPPYPPKPPTAPGTTTAATGSGVFNPLSNGQVFATKYTPLYPCINLGTGQNEYRAFDVDSPFNDPLLSSFYFWKIEEVAAYRNPTVRTVIVTYKDVGLVDTKWTITAAQDDQTVTSQTVSKTLGNKIPTGRLLAIRIDFDSPPVTGQLLQLSMFREQNAGAFQIAKVVMQVEVEDSTL